MKTIGLIGGMSWESTIEYYRVINETVKECLGGLHSAKCVLYSVDFEEIEHCQAMGEWEKSGEILAGAARSLCQAGADFFLICTNTMHKVCRQVQTAVPIPLLHIAEVTADSLAEQNVTKVALLGTRYTMEHDFYKQRLQDRGLTVLIPGQKDRKLVNRVIYDELCLGAIREESRREYLQIITQLAEQGAQGVILGCTEIGLLVKEADSPLPVFDTTLLHARRAALEAMKEDLKGEIK